MSHDPATEYDSRLQQRRDTHQELSRADVRLAAARLVILGGTTLMGILVWTGWIAGWWFLLPAIVFAALMVRHDRVIRAREAASRAISFYGRGLARVEDRWHGTGEPGDRFRDDRHPYANDLDLFGAGSLFELLTIARTRPGEATLAEWLKTPAVPGEIRARQDAIRELTPALDLREKLSLAGAEIRAGVDGDRLVSWAGGPVVLSPPWVRFAALFITAGTVASAIVAALTDDPRALITMLIVQSLFSTPRSKRIRKVLHAADGPARNLDVLSHLLEQLERESFASPKLAALRLEIEGQGVRASVAIRRLRRLIEMHDWQHNMIFAPVALALMWGTHVAWAIEGWRAAHGQHILRWLRAVGEFEALASLSAYRFEHPADPFPEIVANSEGRGEARQEALYDGRGLGHPLLPASRMVRNDVRLSVDQRLLIVSGSNMSGKSTLLRTTGVNAVLALAGAPVRATSLRLSPLTVGATLRIQDSLQEGRSRFYAEVTRIRELADLAAGPIPLLFLLDELLHGTNSHDRLVGASGILRSLLERGGIGLITTHDLALTSIADALSPHASNVHFDDWFEQGELRFDYTVKPGPVTRSNAIALMRAVGLDIRDPGAGAMDSGLRTRDPNDT